MNRQQAETAFRAGFLFTELHFLLHYNFTVPLQGLPPSLYLQIRARGLDALELLPRNSSSTQLIRATKAGLELVKPTIGFDINLNDAKQVSTYMKQSKQTAEEINIEMGEFRGQLDQNSYLCFTSGWAISVVATHTRSLRRLPSVFENWDGPPKKKRPIDQYEYFRLLSATLPFVADLAESLAHLSVSDQTRAVSCLPALSEIHKSSEHDKMLGPLTLRVMQEIADNALLEKGLDTIFEPLVGELEAKYLDLDSPAVNDQEVESSWQSLELARIADNEYLSSRSVSHLNSGIEACMIAIGSLPSGLPPRVLAEELLARLKFQRYQHLGDIKDLDDALRRYFAALESLPAEHQLIAPTLSNLAYALTVRFGRIELTSDIDMAIDCLELALRGRDRPTTEQETMWWANLANAYRQRFLHDKTFIGYLERALVLYEELLRVARRDSRNYPGYLQNWSNVVHELQAAKGEVDSSSLRDRIKLLREVADSYNDLTPEIPRAYANLGLTLKRTVASDEAVEESKALLRKAVTLGLELCLPEALENAINWGDSAFRAQAWDEAAEAYAFAGTAAEQLFRIQLSSTEKAIVLKSTQGMAASSAFALARIGRLADALNALESGLARMLAERLERGRRDLEILRKPAHKKIYDKYCNLSETILERVEGSKLISTENMRSKELSLDQLRASLDSVISDIQKIRGFEGFLRRLTVDEISGLCEQPLVYLYATDQGGQALVVQKDEEICLLELPGLDNNWVRNTAMKQTTGINSYIGVPGSGYNASDVSGIFKEICDSLWKRAIGPVINAVGTNEYITLVPVGLLGLLPLHAACSDSNGESETPISAVDHVSFVYAPNAHSLAVFGPLEFEEPDILLGIQISDSRRGDLPWAEAELAIAEDLFGRATILKNEEASPKRVLEEMSKARIVHFSCHGVADLKSPMDSGLVLGNDELLTVRQLTASGQINATLVVLSACETGVSGLDLPDEVIGLPTAFQQLGAAAVIATLWPVGDSAAAFLSIRFYFLWQVEHLCAVEAFRNAQRWLRDSTWGEIERFMSSLNVEINIPVSDRGIALIDERPFEEPIYWAPFYWTGRDHNSNSLN